MNREPQRCCPVCWRGVARTMFRHNVQRHWDSAGIDICPASSEPYRITLPERPVRQEVTAA